MPGVAAIASTLSSACLSLDHGQRDDALVRALQIRFHVGNASQHHGAGRTPAAVADRRKFRGADEGLGVGHGIDHRRDDALGAEIQRAAGRAEVAERNAHDRCGAPFADGRDACHRCGGIPEPVLLVDGDGGETLARQRLDDQRFRHGAPAGCHGLAGLEPLGQ